MREAEVDIVDFNHDGRGRGVYDGRTYLVSQAYPGERVKVYVDRESSKTVQGRVSEVIRKAPGRIESPCVHLNQCTGCPFIGATGTLEETFKRAELESIFRDSGSGYQDIAYLRPTGAYHYRHYAKWNLLETRGRISVGAYVMGTHVLIENEKCQVVTPLIQKTVARVLDILNRLKVRIHNDERKGLRYLVIRQSHIDNRLLLTLVDSRPKFETENVRDRLRSELEVLQDGLDVAWMINIDEGNVLLSSEWMPLVGECVIDEELAGVRLSIGPESFFQINPEAAEKMFAQLSSWVTGGRVLELFAGVGALSVLLAPVVSELVTVENNEASVELAKATMVRLDHSHVSCHCDDAYDVSEFLSAGHSFDAVVVDPPGKGLGPELIKTLVDSDIREVLMLACRANALRRDLPLLIGGGFSIAEASLVDQFPRTGQFETMLKLVR